MALKSLSDTKVVGPRNNRKWYDGIQLLKFKPKEWTKVRLFGTIYTDAFHRVETEKSAYSETCLGYDWENDRYFEDQEDRCECCKLNIKGQVRHFINALSIEAWENQPRNPPPDWSPIYLASLSPTVIKSLLKYKAKNNKIDLTDSAHGALVSIFYDPNEAPASQYEVSFDQADWQFTEEMLGLPAFQTMPDRTRKIQKGDGTSPGGYEYIRSAASLAEMKRSLERNGYYGTAPADEATPKVKERSAGILLELDRMNGDGNANPPPRNTNVKQLAIPSLDEEAEDNTPPPRKAPAANGNAVLSVPNVIEEDDMPF